MKLTQFLVGWFLLSFVALAATPVFALPLFQDDFNAESIGVPKTGFANWVISDGSVDLIGVGSSWNWFPAYGRYVDMDGTTSPMDAGKITTKTSFNLLAGQTYALEFDLAGNQRADQSDSVVVQLSVETLLNKTFSLPSNAGFTHFIETFIPTVDTTAAISFEGTGGDNVGMLLDNVKLTAVPEPATMLLVGTGIIGLAGFGKRLRRKAS